MPRQSNEANIILAIEAIRRNPKISIRQAAKIYRIPRATLSNRIQGLPPRAKIRNGMLNLTSTEEETLVRHILDLDLRGFPPWFNYAQDMANLLLATRHAPPVGKQ